ncbi:Stk1 family PASTA domain-containing Ser/Thr kinase [Leuconostocaceae bacterium ESL0958]|nr:Stk1 family PASTA domain-containing Ser/Thr kinase [Leuconostocaceae bacterium ESL0958]
MEIGTVINDRYEVIRVLGGGGMANIYQGFDRYLKRDVTIKVIRLDLQDNAQMRARFLQEAQTIADIVNEHIVSIYDMGEFDHTAYLIMEYVAGMDLKSYLKQHFPIPYQQVVNLMLQILSAVTAAHQAGVIHRDLKPQNILINQQGQVKITDFGIATAEADPHLTQAHQVIGSVHYLAPELLRGQAATEQSDLYALGVLLYELLTNQRPYDGERAEQVAWQHQERQMPAVRALDPDIPQPLENVIFRATAKNPLDRYESAEEMAADLSTALFARRAREAPFQPTVAEETKVMPTEPSPKPNAKDEAGAGQPQQSVNEAILDAGRQGQSIKNIAKQVDRTPKYVRQVLQQNGIPYRSKKKWVLLVTTLLLLGAIFGAWRTFQSNYVQLPDVSMTSKSQAEKRLAAIGLDYQTTYQVSTSVPKNQVISTKQKVGRYLKKGSQVKLLVSSGHAKVNLSDYSGWTYSAAADRLNQQGLTVKKKMKNADTVPAGQVLSQSLSAGKAVDPNSTITLTVSAGPATAAALPDFQDWQQGDVQTWADQAGLLVNFSQKNDNTAAGRVLSQQPAKGSRLKKGQTITVVISAGPAQQPQDSSTGSQQNSANNQATTASNQSN